MIQVLPADDTWQSHVSRGLGQGLKDAFARHAEQQYAQQQAQLAEQKQQELFKQQSIALKEAGYDISPELLANSPLATQLAKDQGKKAGMNDFFSRYNKSQGESEAIQGQQTQNNSQPGGQNLNLAGFQGVTPDMISEGLISPYPEVRSWAEGAQKAQLEQQKFQFEEKKLKSKTEQEREKHILPLQETARAELKESSPKVFALQNMLTAAKNGDVDAMSGANLSRIFRNAGYDSFADAVQTAPGAFFETNGKAMILGAANRFKGALSDRDLALIEKMNAAVGRSREANEVAIYSLMVPELINQERSRFFLKINDENPEMPVSKINSIVHDHMQDYEKQMVKDFRHKLFDADAAILKQKKTKPGLFDFWSKATSEKQTRPSQDELYERAMQGGE